MRRRRSQTPIVLGVDPGADHLGWAVLLGRQYQAAGTITLSALSFATVAGAVRELRGIAVEHAVRTVAVERVERVNARPGFGSTMATGLCHGHGVGQRVAQAFDDDGLLVLECSAEDWHMQFFNQRAVDGAAVAAMLGYLVEGWPRPRTRGIDGHARDAGGVALWAVDALSGALS